MSRAAARLAFSSRVLRKTLSRMQVATVRLRGTSMRPLLRDGMMVRLRSIRSGEPRPGQIIAVDQEGHPVLHRTLVVDGEYVCTWADALQRPDAPCARKQVIGVAEAVRAASGPWLPAPQGVLLGRLLRSLHTLWRTASWARARVPRLGRR